MAFASRSSVSSKKLSLHIGVIVAVFYFLVLYLYSGPVGTSIERSYGEVYESFISGHVTHDGESWFVGSPHPFDESATLYPSLDRAIVPKIWQTDSGMASMRSGWWRVQHGHTYELLNETAAETLVQDLSSAEIPKLYEIYSTIETPIVRSDLLRYLVLYMYGGYYSDADVTPLLDLGDWIPKEFDRATINTIIGIEVDEPTFSPEEIEEHHFTSNLQFCQWTLASNPGHKIMRNVISSILSELSIDHSNATDWPSEMDVLQSTGPGAYTRAVLQYMTGLDPKFDKNVLFLIDEPVQVADVLFMPRYSFAYDAFSSREKSEKDKARALVVHEFHASENEKNDLIEPISRVAGASPSRMSATLGEADLDVHHLENSSGGVLDPLLTEGNFDAQDIIAAASRGTRTSNAAISNSLQPTPIEVLRSRPVFATRSASRQLRPVFATTAPVSS